MFLTDKALSIMLLLQRGVFALALGFWAAGEILHFNAFVQNLLDIGLPMARPVAIFIVVLALLSAAGILLGFFFRTACCGAAAGVVFSAFFFFAGNINRVNLLISLFAATLLVGFLFMGPGQISLDDLLAQRRAAKKSHRIQFR